MEFEDAYIDFDVYSIGIDTIVLDNLDSLYKELPVKEEANPVKCYE